MTTSLEEARQKFFGELRIAMEESRKQDAMMQPKIEETRSNHGYSHSDAMAGDRLISALDHRVPSIKMNVTDRAGGAFRFEVTPDELREFSQETEEQAFYIIQSAVVDTAIRIVNQSQYQYDETKKNNDKRAIRHVLGFFSHLETDDGLGAMSQRDQILIALLGSGYLTGWKVDLDADEFMLYNDQNQGHEYKGENYIERSVVLSLAHSLFGARYTLPEEVMPAFNGIDKLHRFYRKNMYHLTKIMQEELPHTGYDALIAYHIKTVLLGEQPDIVISDSGMNEDMKDYLGG